MDTAKVWIQQGLHFVQEVSGLQEREAIMTVMTVFISLFVIILLSGRRSHVPESHICCATKFAQQRKKLMAEAGIVPIPASAGASSSSSGGVSPEVMHEIHQQLTAIQREIQNLKHEREAVDNELIETSTQILQTIGASLMAGEEEGENQSYVESVPSPKVMKPVAIRSVPAPVAAVVSAVRHDPSPASRQKDVTAPVEPITPNVPQPIPRMSAMPTHQVEQPMATHLRAAVPAQPADVPAVQVNGVQARPVVPMRPVVAPIQTQTDSQMSSPASSPYVPRPQAGPISGVSAMPPMEGPAKAAPKMSAIAAARMKREQEQAEAQGMAVPKAVSNPFAKPKSGPFGAPVQSQ